MRFNIVEVAYGVLVSALLTAVLLSQVNPPSQSSQVVVAVEITESEIETPSFLPMPSIINLEDEIANLAIDVSCITSKSNITTTELAWVLADTGLNGLAEAYIMAERAYGVNAVYLVSLTILESGWGESNIANDKNNLSGFGAYDSDPYRHAVTFYSLEQSIMETARLLRLDYINQGLDTLELINTKYASDENWNVKIKDVVYTVISKINS